MAAGDLLTQAKAQVPHGQWLPWLHDHCTISERTAQLYTKNHSRRLLATCRAQSNDATAYRA